MRENAVVLLVDDDPVDCEGVIRAFTAYKVSNPIEVVHDGVEALEYLRRKGAFAGAARPLPALILMDLKMPRMDGLECLREIKDDGELCHIPVVMFTSSRQEEDVMASYRDGAASYIAKPATFEKLTEAIRTFDLYWTLSELPR